MPRSGLDALVAGCLMAPFPGHRPPRWLLERLEGGLGGVCLFAGNVASREQVAELVAALRAVRPDVVVALDEEGGDVTRLHAAGGSPHAGAATLGAADDVALTCAVGSAIGAELAAVGVDVDLAPCLDVNSDPANPVIGVRSFGADPDLVARHGVAFVEGLRSAGIGACAKHFPGHGDTSVDSHLDLPAIRASRHLLEGRELVPFRAAIQAGVAAVMPSHLLVPALDDEPASVSRRILVEVLRGELGFAGAIVTDALDMRGICREGGIAAATVRALAAGADLCCLGAVIGEAELAAVHRAVVGAVARGALDEGRLAEAASRAAGLRARRSAPVTRGSGSTAASDHAARRALQVEGTLREPCRRALVVTCRAEPNIAAGDVPWGIAADVCRRDPSARAVDAGPATRARTLLAQARTRPLVVVARDAHRHGWQAELLAALAAERPDVVCVEMGWPAPATVPVAARLLTFGAARPNASAAAELLVGGPS
jgi:beta-N-acetylhexosaminidase